ASHLLHEGFAPFVGFGAVLRQCHARCQREDRRTECQGSLQGHPSSPVRIRLVQLSCSILEMNLENLQGILPNMHRENWDDLRYVLAVAEAGSVSGAARALGVNHATV